jgi:endoglucanase
VRFARLARALVLVAVVAVLVLASAPAPVVSTGQIRVDQVGYGIAESKQAYLMANDAVPGAKFTVLDSTGRTALTGVIGANLGRWSNSFGAVHAIDFSGVSKPGTYRISVTGAVTATSPSFKIGTTADLFTPLVAANVEFFQAQRDGSNVVAGRLNRKPSHLADKQAFIYDTPQFKGTGGDEPAEPLKRVGGPIDVEGGWFDAGDFVKFTHATSYALSELLYAQRAKSTPELDAETAFGLKWLDKMWDEDNVVLYAQVGIGTGSAELKFLGDHDVWRLPEDDDELNVEPGDEKYFIKHRPVFRAAAPGQQISPNLAGRVSATFALAAQVEAERNPALARRYLDEAASIFAMARTSNVGELVTAFPHEYYPEDSWADDLEYGATELALAGHALDDSRAHGWTKTATHWAKRYLDSGYKSTLNLYDTSALAHHDLVRLLRGGAVSGAEVTEEQLIGDLERQLRQAAAAAASSPFGTAAKVNSFDAGTLSFGFAATAQLHRSLTGDKTYDRLGTQQRNFTLGSNAWGTTFVVGVGTSFPLCPHHQAANIAGDPGGGSRILFGAVINGPNAPGQFERLSQTPEGAKPCTKPYTRPFDSTTSRFVDGLTSWRTSEPAIDFTSTAALAFTLTATG